MAKQLRGDSIALTEGLLIAGWWLLGDGLALSVTFGDSSPKGRALGASPCPLYKYTENPIGKGRSTGKTQKNRFSSCKTGQNALF